MTDINYEYDIYIDESSPRSIQPDKIKLKTARRLFSYFRQIKTNEIIPVENRPGRLKWHTSVDLLAHAWGPNLNIGSFFSSTCFLH